MIRPRPARWFELLVARDDATLALEALAATGAVELEARPGAMLDDDFADLRSALQEFRELASRYRGFWPTDHLHPSPFPEPALAALGRCVARIRAWAVQAEPLVRQLQHGAAEAAELRHWRNLLAHLGEGPLDLSGAARAGPQLQARLLVLPAGSEPDTGEGPLVCAFEADGRHYTLALGTPAHLHELAQQAMLRKGEVYALPSWLGTSRAGNEAELARRQAALAGQERGARAALDALAERHGLREALGNAQRLQWVMDNVQALESDALLCWITGWTSVDDDLLLARAIEHSGARALLRLPPPPADARAPLLLVNPWWARPFEVFSRALGMPSGTEADASVLLAFAVPLMFGYMFGDLGQGLVIAAAGFALRRRWPMARLFIAGGLCAAVFGLLFGSVFGLHLLPPWWVAPLADPLVVLLVPLAGGAVLLTLGMLLSALGANWRGELARWLATDAGLLACYLGVLAAVVWPPAWWIAGGGALYFCAGHAWHARTDPPGPPAPREEHRPALARRALAGAGALAELVERLLQLLVNTLSFARVGAFALAHAGLSSAIVALMQAADNAAGGFAVLVAGNLVVIVLEGLVVSVQTTRLVLFEFFTRFLQAQGRVFRPLPPPPSTLQES